MRLRASIPVFLLALLAGTTMAGCFEPDEDKPRLAQPTNATAGPKVPVTPSNPVIVLNFSDPGYRMNATWHVGDGWDWESDKGRFRTMRVVESRSVGGATHYLVEETAGKVGNPPNARSHSWVDGETWRKLNTTDIQGWLTTYAPGLPLRHNHNGSYNYTEQRFDQLGRRMENYTVYANVAYVNNDVVIRLPWAQVATGKLEHRIVAVDASRAQNRTQITHWVSRDYANDVRFQIDLDETFTLTAARVDGRTFRELRAT